MSAGETDEPALRLIDSEQDAFRRALATDLDGFLQAKRELLTSISTDSLELLNAIARLTQGGKKLRALLNYWGWRGAGGIPGADEAVRAGTALELFQAAALIHDDIIDRSDTRRGSPSVHRQFLLLHQESGWKLNSERFGNAAAILAGDMCLSFSEELFTSIGERAAFGGDARSIFNRMRTEVMAGQYLDLLEEAAGPVRPADQAAERAWNILRYKSAKYSTEHPLALGGALAGASDGLLQGYSSFSLPLGEAFQLRDDVLGVFGDPARTGKPAGDDLREGKRTVLIVSALESGNSSQRAEITQSLGDDAIDDRTIGRLRTIIEDTGALAYVEELIAQYGGAAFTALEKLPVDEVSRTALAGLGRAAVARTV